MIDLESFLKKMEAGTASSSASGVSDLPDEKEETPLQILKQEFASMFAKVKAMHIPVDESPIYVDQGVYLKRTARYIESSRIYGNYAIEHRVFTPNLAMAWFKTLASGGDVKDALTEVTIFYPWTHPSAMRQT